MKLKREGKRFRLFVEVPESPFSVPITRPLLKSQIMKVWRKLDKIRELDGLEINFMDIDNARISTDTLEEARAALCKVRKDSVEEKKAKKPKGKR